MGPGGLRTSPSTPCSLGAGHPLPPGQFLSRPLRGSFGRWGSGEHQRLKDTKGMGMLRTQWRQQGQGLHHGTAIMTPTGAVCRAAGLRRSTLFHADQQHLGQLRAALEMPLAASPSHTSVHPASSSPSPAPKGVRPTRGVMVRGGSGSLGGPSGRSV